MPFGLNQNDNLIHISEVENGKKCGCICPSCKLPLTAAKGKIKQHHFKHTADIGCENGLESAIHLAAKKIIKEKMQIILPEYLAYIEIKDSKDKIHREEKLISSRGQIINFELVEEEVSINDMRVDLLGKKKDTPLIIEIYFRHKVGLEKMEKIKKSNISALEIDLSELSLEDIKSWDTFWSFIVDPKRIQWLHNAQAQNHVYPNLRKLVIEKIGKAEKKYIKEIEINELKLKKALKNIEFLKSETNIRNIKHKADSSQKIDYCKRNLFSSEDLPFFLDVEVPDGDWIFGCDRRHWQLEIYRQFLKLGKRINLKFVDGWIKKRLPSKTHQIVKTVGIYGRKYPEIVLNYSQLREPLPNTWKTISAYFQHLCELNMLMYTDHGWYMVLSKEPREELVIPDYH